MELSVCPPISRSVVPILVATQERKKEIHCSTYIVSHVVRHNAPKLQQASEVPAPLEGPFLRTNHLGKVIPDFRMFLINCRT